MIRKALAGLGLMVVFLGGCGTTPAQRWDAATSGSHDDASPGRGDQR